MGIKLQERIRSHQREINSKGDYMDDGVKFFRGVIFASYISLVGWLSVFGWIKIIKGLIM